MQPICISLPVRADLANGIWTVLELGFEERALRRFPDAHHNARPAAHLSSMAQPHIADSPDHLRILAVLFRDHLHGTRHTRNGLWLERRELAEVLRLLDGGLVRFVHRYPQAESTPLILNAVSDLLCSLRTQLGILRKPAQRQTTPRMRAASAAGG